MIAVVICFAVTAAVVYGKPAYKPCAKQHRLDEAFSNLEGWKSSDPVPLDENIVKSLDLDDYVSRKYSNGTGVVYLYIGYYLSSGKVGAAHDPLVCFPGQGWILSDRSRGKLRVADGGRETVSFSSMIAQLGEEKELIVYWFQSYDNTSADTFSQKICTSWTKLKGGGEDNAFVRVSTPLEGKTQEEGKEIIFRLIREFYPVFLKYIRAGNEKELN